MLERIIMDDIDRGHFDRDLGELARTPKYAEYTAIELKSILVDRISDNMLPINHYGLRWPMRILGVLLFALVVFAVVVGGAL